MLTLHSVGYSIQNRALLKDISFHLGQGEMMAVLGANGAGKSTLLRLLSAERSPSRGVIHFRRKDLAAYSHRELASLRTVLSQQNSLSMPFQVEEVVMMGRYPHFSHRPGRKDTVAVAETMEVCGLSHLADRNVLTLSGGEQQRVQFARALAQIWDRPQSLILMDEPVAALDPEYQQQLLAITKALCCHGFTSVAVLHEINLAAQYADRILMLKNGRKWHDGTPAEVLTPSHIYTVFNAETEVFINPKTLRPYVMQKEVKLDASRFNSLLPLKPAASLTFSDRSEQYQNIS